VSENWKLHDLVVVKQQPKMQPFVQIEGLIAVITEIDGDYATICELQLSGRAEGGSGAVELACLEKPTKVSGPMRAAYAVYKQDVIKYYTTTGEPEDTEEAKKRRRRALKIIAEKYSIEPKSLHKILKDLDAAEVIQYYWKRTNHAPSCS